MSFHRTPSKLCLRSLRERMLKSSSFPFLDTSCKKTILSGEKGYSGLQSTWEQKELFSMKASRTKSFVRDFSSMNLHRVRLRSCSVRGKIIDEISSTFCRWTFFTFPTCCSRPRLNKREKRKLLCFPIIDSIKSMQKSLFEILGTFLDYSKMQIRFKFGFFIVHWTSNLVREKFQQGLKKKRVKSAFLSPYRAMLEKSSLIVLFAFVAFSFGAALE